MTLGGTLTPNTRKISQYATAIAKPQRTSRANKSAPRCTFFISPAQKRINIRKTIITLSPLLAPQEPETVGTDPLQEDARVDTEPNVAHGVREYRNQGQHLRIARQGGYKGGGGRACKGVGVRLRQRCLRTVVEKSFKTVQLSTNHHCCCC